MSTLRVLLFIGALVVALPLILGCADDGTLTASEFAAQDGAGDTPGICWGTVYGYDPNTQTYWPLTGAYVQALTWPNGYEVYGYDYSKANGGYFVIDDPAPPYFNYQGQFTVLVVSKPGYQTQQDWNAWCPCERDWILPLQGER